MAGFIWKAFQRLFLVGLGVSIALLIAEGFLQLTQRYKNYGVPCGRVRGYYVPDEVAGHDLSRNFPEKELLFEGAYSMKIWTNNLGCFDVDFDPRDKEDYILVVGDSFSHCTVRYEDSFATLLERKLGIRVLKCGISGYGTKAELEKAKKVIKEVGYPPRLIILQYCMGNDPVDDYLFPRYTVVNGFMTTQVRVFPNTMTFVRLTEEELNKKFQSFLQYSCFELVRKGSSVLQSIKCYLNEHSYLYRMLKESVRNMVFRIPVLSNIAARFIRTPEEVRQTGLGLMEYVIDKKWDEHFSALRKIKKLADEIDSHLVVLVIPEKAHVFYPEKAPAVHEKLMRKLSSSLDEEGISYVNLYGVLRDNIGNQGSEPENMIYWKLDSHLAPFGHRIAAEELYKKILPILNSEQR